MFIDRDILNERPLVRIELTKERRPIFLLLFLGPHPLCQRILKQKLYNSITVFQCPLFFVEHRPLK